MARYQAERHARWRRVFLASLYFVGALWCAWAVPAQADTHTWTDAAAGNSNWSDGGNWSPAGPPVFGDFVIVPTPGVGVGPVVINTFASIANVEVGANGSTPQVQIQSSRDLVINAGDLDNDGLIVVNSDGGTSAARLRFAAFGGDNLNTLSGTGTILLQAGASTFPTVSPASVDTVSSTLTQQAGHTIRGVGRINATIVNNGEVWADDYDAVPGPNVLELSTGSMTNNGTIGANDGGTLDVLATYNITQGATGAIVATDGGTVQFRNTTIVNGGALQTKGTGVIVTTSSASATRLNSVLNEGNYRVNSGGFTFIDGTGFTNSGVVDLRDSMNYLVSGELDGTGEIVMSGAGSLETQVGVTINHGADHTIRGTGQVTATMVNEGLIEATGTLRVTFNPMTNNNLLRAASGGTLQVEKHVTQDPGTGIIVADNGGLVKLMSTGNVIGGRLQTIGTGLIQAGDNTRLTGVHNQATIEVRPISSSGIMLVEGSGITNDGAIIVNPAMVGGTYGITFCCGPTMTIDGSGYIDLNHTNASLTIASGLKLTNAANHTIKGPGIVQGQGELVNEGLLWGGTIAGAVDMIRVANRLSGTGDLEDVQISGIHAPGNNGPAGINADGIYRLTTGARLEIEVGGAVSGSEFDAIQAHNVDLAGTLDVELINNFMPSAGQVFPFLTYTGGSFGSFTTELLPPLPGGLFFDVAYNTGVVSLQVEGVLGDYNRNGTVDAADYVVWRKSYGESGAGLVADGDGNKLIDDADYDVWMSNFGQIATPIPGGYLMHSGVPEPATWVTLAISVIGLSRIRSRTAPSAQRNPRKIIV